VYFMIMIEWENKGGLIKTITTKNSAEQ